jgi:hypothetical protein
MPCPYWTKIKELAGATAETATVPSPFDSWRFGRYALHLKTWRALHELANAKDADERCGREDWALDEDYCG